MKIHLLSASAIAAIALTCAQTASAGTTVQVSYAAPAVVYAPPPRPVYYAPPYAFAAARTVVMVPVAAPVPPPPPPRAPVVVVPAPVRVYAAPPAVRITYAQPVLAAPVVVMH
ncbi:hypothetical protein [Caballeronia sp. Lep1P3]|uniref:hypothetical protein n=1 Tax=Caballeronia sp. Lep1P3 TaxID=2878150 RepID=UPI001FD00A9B|nr:hypothetical protein [Caballeronia sp. Lep1P3]